MKILEKESLERCFLYESQKPPTVEIRTLEKGHREEMIFRKNEIVFMSEGEVRFMFRNHPEKIHRKGEFTFIPLGGMFRFVATEDTEVTVIRLNGHMSLCLGYPMEELYPRGEAAERGNREIFTLSINRPMQLFLEGLNQAVKAGLHCRNYFDIKSREMFLLLKAYYSHEQLSAFFSSILSPDTMFSEQVRERAPNYATVKEVAGAMNMTPKLFSKKFARVFGEPPTDWMQREKALRVYADLHTGREPIAQIADKYKFSSQSHLNKFCKREFGKNPRKIREEG